METRANYTLIGLFTMAILAGVFGFIYWFQSLGGHTERAFYRVVFEGSVSGLRTGGAVLFNGIRVGEVSKLRLNTEKPDEVVAIIAVEKSVAVRPDTQVSIEFQGLTGIAAVGLTGGTPSEPPLVGDKDNPPTINGNRAMTQDLTQGARQVLQRLDSFIADNQAIFASALKNIDSFTEALARNAERIDHVTAGLENLTGGADGNGGEVNELARTVRKLAEHLDTRTEEISHGINKFTATGTRQLEIVGRDAHQMMGQVERTVKQIGDNPSSLLFGGKK
ncbi:MAG: MlaD family protein [Pseudolabrys sp.]